VLLSSIQWLIVFLSAFSLTFVRGILRSPDARTTAARQLPLSTPEAATRLIALDPYISPTPDYRGLV
jgi:hypothetical protein